MGSIVGVAIRSVVALINASAGSVGDADGDRQAIADAFRAADAGVQVRVEAVDPRRMRDRIRAIWRDDRPDVIVVAGGDGTVNMAANAAAGTDVVIGVLPQETFNHFAGDLGIPEDLEAAARVLLASEVRRVDVGEVNERVFVNNSLVGLYPTMVAVRDHVMASRGWGKVRAVPVAAIRVFRNFSLHTIDLSGSGGFRRSGLRTPMLFVGNGVYANAPGASPDREKLDEGLLGVEITRGSSRWAFVRAAVQSVFRGVKRAPQVDSVRLEELDVDSTAKRLRVAFDGEIDWVGPPLRFRIRPGALHVLAPRGD